MNDRMEAALRASLAGARTAEPTHDEVRAALGRVGARRTRRSAGRRLTLAAFVAVLLGAVSAVPSTRAAMVSAYDSLSAWVRGDGASAPGRPATAEGDVPEWLRQAPGQKRVLAEVAGVRMTIAREDDGDTLTVALGGAFGRSGDLRSWEQLLSRQAITLMGPASIAPGRPFDERGRRPLFGVAADDVTRVELTYRSGSPSVDADVRGGFGLLLDLTRAQQFLVAYDARGRTRARVDLRGVEFRICRDTRGCPPGSREPRRADAR